MILVTGAAGFIGFHVARRLLENGQPVHGLDNLNDYYDPALKEARVRILERLPGFTFHRVDLSDQTSIARLFRDLRPLYVVHLAAQAGVRYSLTHPHAYLESNLTGFLNVLEGCRACGTLHLVYASSSSVYGLNSSVPFSVHQNVDHPVSLYGATKKANELMAHSYSHLYRLPTTGLRFFTVYGPWGRPDMAYYRFTKAILQGEPIEVYNEGRMRRDFTYIDDIVEGVVRVIARPGLPNPQWDGENPDPGSSTAPYRIYNMGNRSSVELLRFIEIIEECLGKKAVRRLLPAQPGDVLATAADVSELDREIGFVPSTPIDVGLRRFTDWYRDYYQA
jgi:UDP-glucuronate 4-epimerase